MSFLPRPLRESAILSTAHDAYDRTGDCLACNRPLATFCSDGQPAPMRSQPAISGAEQPRVLGLILTGAPRALCALSRLECPSEVPAENWMVKLQTSSNLFSELLGRIVPQARGKTRRSALCSLGQSEAIAISRRYSRTKTLLSRSPIDCFWLKAAGRRNFHSVRFA
jgi:hypothetical protein